MARTAGGKKARSGVKQKAVRKKSPKWMADSLARSRLSGIVGAANRMGRSRGLPVCVAARYAAGERAAVSSKKGRGMEYLHTMIRVTDLKATIAFFELMGFVETRRFDNEKGRYTLVFLAAPGDAEHALKDQAPVIELTHNWDPEVYAGGRNFGHLAYRVDDIYATCKKLMDSGVTINRPPRDGHMAFIRTPDAISIELIQKGDSLPSAEPWASMPNTGVW
jgi:lactoylglutathione lyase